MSGHGAAEELKLMLNLVTPRYFVPVHGETRHLHAHAELARAVGMPDENVFVLDNGDCLEIDEAGVHRGQRVESGVSTSTASPSAISARWSCATVSRSRATASRSSWSRSTRRTGAVVGDPELVTRGLVLGADTDEALKGVRTRIDKVLKKTAAEGATDEAVVKKALHDAVSQYVWETARRRPMIIPVVMEV